MAFYGPPMMPMTMPPRPPRRRAPKKRTSPKKTPTPKPMSEQQKIVVAKEAITTTNTVPMKPMDSTVKTEMRTKVIKSKKGTLADARGRLTQPELNSIYYQISNALNSGLGDIGIQTAVTEDGMRLIIKLSLSPPNAIAGKLYKSHAAAALNTDGASLRKSQLEHLSHESTLDL